MISVLATTFPRRFSRPGLINSPRVILFSNTTNDSSDDLILKKKRALFGSVAVSGELPKGKPVERVNSTDSTVEAGISDGSNGKGVAEKAWLESGYIEYMTNQRERGWKT